MPQPKVSIVVPTYVRTELFKALVQSIRDAFPPYKVEIVVVTSDDPGSEKGQWMRRQTDLKVVQADVRTSKLVKPLVVYVNIGIRASTGEWVFVTNDDTLIDRNFYSNLVLIEQNYDAIAVNAHIGIVGLGRRVPIIGTITPPDGHVQPLYLFDFTIMRKKTYEEVGLFDERSDSGAGFDMAMAITTRPHIRVCRASNLATDHYISTENLRTCDHVPDFLYIENKWQKWCDENGWSFFSPWREEDSFEYITKMLQAGLYDKAEEKIRRAILAVWPDHIQALNDLGVICKLRGKNAEALEHFLVAANYSKSDRVVVHNLIGTLLQMERHDEAMATLIAAVASSAEHGLIIRTELYEAVLNKALVAPEPLFHFAAFVAVPTQLLFSNSVTCGNDAIPALYEYARMLLENNQYESAMEQLKNILILDPQNSDALNDLGYAYHKKCDYGKAMEYFGMALSSNSLNYQALRNMLTLSNQLGIGNGALPMLKEILAKNANDPTILQIAQTFINDQEFKSKQNAFKD